MKKVLKKINQPIYIWIGIAVLILLAVFSHFYLLGLRPAHHDEGMLAYFAWKLSSEGSYAYTPMIHGPVLFYFEAIIFKLFGANQNTFRIEPAIFGILLIAIPLFFRRQFKNPTAIWLTVLFLVSPITLYYTRYIVHTNIAIVFWLLTVLYLRWFFHRPSMLPLHLSVLFLALAFGTSEISYIFLAILLLFIPTLFIFSRDGFLKYWRKTKDYFAEDPYQLLSAFLLFVTSWIIIYSVGATNWQSLQTSFPNPFDPSTGLGFAFTQQSQGLGSQPWFYYLLLVGIYEPLILILDLAAIISLKRSKGIFYFFAVWWAIMSLIALSWAGEKFPWLALCPLVAMIFLAALYLGENWGKFKPVLKALIIALALLSVFNSIRTNFTHIADTRELLTYVQTPDVFQKKIDEINKACDKTKNCVAIDQSISWPMSWSFKESSYLFYAEADNKFENTKFIILSTDKASQFKEPDKFKKETIKLRDWWVPDKCKEACAGKYLKYYLFRETYNPKGGYDAYLYQKID